MKTGSQHEPCEPKPCIAKVLRAPETPATCASMTVVLYPADGEP